PGARARYRFTGITADDRRPQHARMRVAGRHKIDVRFDTRALSTAYRRSPKLADRDTQLRCHGGPIGGTNGRRSYASRVMPWLMQAPLNLVEFVVDRFLALDV